MGPEITILLVDDSTMMRRLVSEMLRRSGGFRVIEATHGQDALELLKSEKVDVVLSDWDMGPINGLELLQAMRRCQDSSRIPFIMMTGKQTPALIAEAIAAGPNGYLGKPFDCGQLQRTIQKTLAGNLHAA